MAAVVYSGVALAQLRGELQRLRDERQELAVQASTAIRSAVDALAVHPLLGRRAHGELRELIISCGRTGYVALYRFLVQRDEVRMLSLRSQRDVGLVP